MRVFVGTSGWFYSWNPERRLDWFVSRSGLNAVELNASFYRFPFPNQVKSWANKGKNLRWAVKVSRLVTHQYRFSEEGYKAWEKFRALFEPLDFLIDFYLFQLPPQLTPQTKQRIGDFVRQTGLGKRFALECRNNEWLNPETELWAKELGITLVSVDAPTLSREIFNSSGLIYLRMHGREGWYHHNYTSRELREVVQKVRAKKPKAAYVFFNNDEAMLNNARMMLKLLSHHPDLSRKGRGEM
ncbi:DUF72 domain-containing protein [candidate division WOR-3 bacterium]|nr:DUF72 domain-containing protein [candidate division WOR-3 bacterium]